MATPSPTAVAPACEHALRALLDARWLQWSGLPAECTLGALETLLGGSTVLDVVDTLGSERTECTRSSLNDAPVLVWHRDQQVLLVEHDLLSSPAAAPPPAALRGVAVHRLDVALGPATLEGGEWVLAERGLALVVTSTRRVVAALGFAATTPERYVAALRPRRGASLLPQPFGAVHRAGAGGDR